MEETHERPHADPAIEILGRVWRDRPYVPRAIALLLYLLETDEALEDLTGTGEAELSATALAETQAIRRSFEAVFGLPWRACLEVFARATLYSSRHPRMKSGDEVIYEPTVRMLYDLGYTDGRDGARQAPPRIGPEPPMPEAKDEEESQTFEHVQSIVEAQLNPAYQRGYDHGRAERQLRAEAPDLKALLDQAATSYLTENRRIGASVLADKVRAYEQGLAQDDVEAALSYAQARTDYLRATVAEKKVAGYMAEEVSVLPLAVASVLRVLSAALARATDELTDNQEREDRSDDIAEALLMAAAEGLEPGTVADLLEVPPADSVVNLVASASRDTAHGRHVRSLLNHIGQSRVLEGTEPPVRSWPHRTGVTVVGNLTVDDDFRTILHQLRRGPEAPAPFGDLARYRQRLEKLDGPAEVVAPLVLRALESRLALGPVEESADLAVRFARTEARALKSVGTTLGDRLEDGLNRLRAEGLADALLQTWDPTGRDRTLGEVEVLDRTGDRFVETVEAWLSGYRAEARLLGMDTETVGWLSVVPQETPAAEGTLLLARARILEGALERYARREAERLVALHVPVIARGILEAEDAERVLKDVFRVAAFQSVEAAEARKEAYPRFGQRVSSWVPAASLNAMAVEVEFAEETREEVGA